jgi:hypothetical protein
MQRAYPAAFGEPAAVQHYRVPGSVPFARTPALKRIQCKYCGAVRAQVDLRQIHSNSHGFVVRRVPRGAYDWLYILAADGCEYLIKECLYGRRSVDLQAAYRLGAVAESG